MTHLIPIPRARFLGFIAALLAVTVALSLSNASVLVAQTDTTAPTITSIEFGDPNTPESPHFHGIGVHGIGATIEVDVTFSEEVTVTGTPKVTVQVGAYARDADYVRTSESEVIFSYTVVKGDQDTNGAGVAANKVRLNDGTIRDASGNDAVLTHSAITDGSNHLVDGIPPRVTSLQWISSNEGTDGIYTVGDRLYAWVEFTERITNYDDFDSENKPRLKVNLEDDVTDYAIWKASNAYFFIYTVPVGAMQMDGASTPVNPIELNGADLRDQAGNAPIMDHAAIAQNTDFRIDGVSPTIKSIAITSDPGTDKTYSTSDTIEVTVTFSEPVRVPNVAAMRNGVRLSGIPALALTVGSNTRSADYDSVSGASVVFTYDVQAGDDAPSRVAVPANAITLNGGRIQDAVGEAHASTNQANLSHSAVSDNSSQPTISGTAQVGETLTADTSSIADEDGLDDATFSYQWIANDGTSDADISGATGATYALTDAEEGSAIKVNVSFTDDAGNEESLTSATTAAVVAATNTAATGAPTISGTTQVGETLTAETSGIADADGLTNVSYSYQWLSSRDTEMDGATSSTYTLQASDEGKTIKVQVSFTDDNRNDESLTSDATTTVLAQANSPATGAPTISGTVQVGQTLTAETSGIADADGLTNVSYSYQWIRNDGTSDADIENATGSSYILVATDEGKTIKLRVSFTDDGPNDETLTSVATVTVAPPPLTVSVENSPLEHNGTDTFTFDLRFSENVTGLSYATLEDHAFTVTGGEVQGARRLDAPSNIRWQITVAPDGNGSVTIVLPIPTNCSTQGAVCAGDSRKLSNRLEFTINGTTAQQNSEIEQGNSEATGSPTINGTAQVGQMLTVSTSDITDADGLTNPSYAYQWIANDGSSDSDIQDATSSSYTLVADDAGKAIKVKATFTDDAQNEESRTSDATAAVAAAVPSAPAGLTVSVNNTGKLDLSWNIPDSNGGANVTGYKVQWRETADSWESATDVSEATATGTTHTVSGLTDGTEYTFRVMAVNSEGAGEASSGATATPVNTTPLTATTHDAPSSHDGTTAFTFELRLSEEPKPSFSYTTMHEHAFTVTGGSVTGAHRLNPPSNVGWEITVQPSGNADVTVSLPATTDCSAEGAICTSDSRMFSGGLELVVPGPPSNSAATGAPTIGGTTQVGATLTASTSGISDADGLANATFTYQWLADVAVISDATGSTYTLAGADAGKAIKVKVSFTDDVGNAESLTSAATAAVARPPLTATVHDKPSSHDGSNTFTFELRFSENIEGLSYTTLQEHALTVTGGTLPKVRRLEPGQNVRWEITVQPSSDAGVTIVLPITTDCSAQGAICTSDSRKLSKRLEVTVPGQGG